MPMHWQSNQKADSAQDAVLAKDVTWITAVAAWHWCWKLDAKPHTRMNANAYNSLSLGL